MIQWQNLQQITCFLVLMDFLKAVITLLRVLLLYISFCSATTGHLYSLTCVWIIFLKHWSDCLLPALCLVLFLNHLEQKFHPKLSWCHLAQFWASLPHLPSIHCLVEQKLFSIACDPKWFVLIILMSCQISWMTFSSSAFIFISLVYCVWFTFSSMLQALESRWNGLDVDRSLELPVPGTVTSATKRTWETGPLCRNGLRFVLVSSYHCILHCTNSLSISCDTWSSHSSLALRTLLGMPPLRAICNATFLLFFLVTSNKMWAVPLFVFQSSSEV